MTILKRIIANALLIYQFDDAAGATSVYDTFNVTNGTLSNIIILTLSNHDLKIVEITLAGIS